MKSFTNAEWIETACCWEVFITDGDRVGRFRVVACNEFVIPLAEMAFNGLDVKAFIEWLEEEAWSVTEIESEDDE